MIHILNDIDTELINELYTNGTIKKNGYDIKENDIITLKNGSKSAICIVRGNTLKLVRTKKLLKSFQPDNLKQTAYVNYLLDPDIRCVLCTGVAGSGKSLMAIAVAYEEIINGNYQQLVIMRPPVSPSKKFNSGFVPGTLSEKLRPWMEVFFSSLDKVKHYFRRKDNNPWNILKD
jgi:PhoH-like ATPase